MEFRILGPLEVRDARGRPCPLAPLHMRVLAVLLLNPNQMVGWRHLIDAVWDDNPPATAKRQIQNGISALRRRLAAAGVPGQVILADRAGYEICIGHGQLDAQMFRDLVAEARALAAVGDLAQAVDQLKAALLLWRGPALAGCAGRAIEAGAAGLDEQRFAAVESRFDLELQLGRCRDLIGELTELVASYPLRERSVGQLMLALHSSGRQAEALATYQQLCARLADELGIDPGEELQQIHTAILRNEVAVRPAGATSAPAAPRPRAPEDEVAGQALERGLSIKPPAGARLKQAKWHLARYDSLHAVAVIKASTVLTANVLILAANLLLISRALGGHTRPLTWLEITVTAGGVASLTLAALSVVAAAQGLVPRKPWRKRFGPDLLLGAFFQHNETLLMLPTFAEFADKFKTTSPDDELDSALLALWARTTKMRTRNEKVRRAIVLLFLAMVALSVEAACLLLGPSV